MTERGKRKAAARTEAFWALYALLSLAALVWGNLPAHSVDALVGLFWAVTGACASLSFGLRGLDAAHSQIIPAWKGGKHD